MPKRLKEPCRDQNGNVGFSETKKPGRLGDGQPGRQVQQSKEFSFVCFHILRKLILRWNRRSHEAVVEADSLTIMIAIQWIELMSGMDHQRRGAVASPSGMNPLLG